MANTVPNCFLCGPDRNLLYSRSEHGFAMTGLGPVVPGYSIVATTAHNGSMADVEGPALGDLENLLSRVRWRLSETYGTATVTEHGRMPICTEDINSAEADQHCYHAHLLVFPNAPSIIELAQTYFGAIHTFTSLRSAASFARNAGDYFLVSPNNDAFHILTNPLHVPRQLARWLVADAIGEPLLADWRRFPFEEKCRVTASELRQILKEP